MNTKKGKADADVVEDVIKTDEEREKAFTEIVKRAITKLDVQESAEKPTLDVSNIFSNRERNLNCGFRIKTRLSEPVWSRLGCYQMPHWL